LQAISYLADIYMEIQEPEPHAGRFALYMAFFPKLLQGPIERAENLLPQLKQAYRFDYDNMRSGLLLFAWGLFKKVVIADRLALYVNAVYGDVHAYSGLPLLLATYFYALQIYFDFSGYTDMALGVGRLFNLRLTQNFKSPYLATSVADFWRRWHISFSRWILDYIFKPLQMTWRNWGTKGTAGMAVALLVTFLASGVWHGARWGFVVWGVTHGVYLAVSVYWKPHQEKLHKALRLEKTWVLRVWQTVITFHLICFSWIFFRAPSLSDALYVVNNLFAGFGNTRGFLFQHGATELAALLMGLSIIFAVRLLWTSGREMLDYPGWLRWAGYVALVEWLMLFNIDIQRAFIYFQF
jgi:alginate O-acetyltransferase complex protein AlgI